MKTRHLCANCNNETYYMEFDPDWHGLYVLKYTCTKCGCSPVWSEIKDIAKMMEREDIVKMLSTLNPKGESK